MNALQIKTFLWKRGLTISEIARAIEPEYDATLDSIRTMLTNLFYHGKWNSQLAALVEQKFKITVDRPSRPQTVREAVRRSALKEAA